MNRTFRIVSLGCYSFYGGIIFAIPQSDFPSVLFSVFLRQAHTIFGKWCMAEIVMLHRKSLHTRSLAWLITAS